MATMTSVKYIIIYVAVAVANEKNMTDDGHLIIFEKNKIAYVPIPI